jgi:magnesium chelatase accessory protein
MDELEADLSMIAPDLPGHGGTRLGTLSRSGLMQMAEDVAKLLAAMEIAPDYIIGHSAGAAIALAMDPALSPRGQILINAALEEFEGFAGWLFPAMAKGLSAAPFAAELMSRNLGRNDKLRGLLASTGSPVSDEMLARYLKLARNPDHIKGTLRMMASWDLATLQKRLPDIDTPVLLIAGERDGTVPISVSNKAEKTLKHARLEIFPGGHLLQEEDPFGVADAIKRFLETI